MKITSSIKPHPGTEEEEDDDDEKQVYDVTFMDRIILATATPDPDVVTQWIEALNEDGHSGIRNVGFDYEYDFDTIRIGTLQLCLLGRCLVYQLPAGRLPPSLDQFLGNENYIFVGINVTLKMDQLKKQCPFESSPKCMDTDQDLMEKRQGLQETLELTVDNDWDRPMKLSHKQVLFACLDAYLILYLLE